VAENVWIVSSPPATDGVGTRLLHLGEAVWLGRTYGCPVIVDWRGTTFLKDASLNYFTEFFVPVSEIGGVPIHYAPSAALDDYERVSAGERLELGQDALAELVAQPSTTPRYLFMKDAQRLHRSPDCGSYRALLADFYPHIVPRADVADQLDSWYEANLQGHFVVGVNVSTGNGLFAPGARHEGHVNTGIFEDEVGFLAAISTACERATRNLEPGVKRDFKIFYATDSAEMAALLGRLPNAVTRRTVFPPAGAGRYFCDYDALGYSDRAAAADQIIDMWLLARCNALIRNRSRFNLYARVMTRKFNGNVQRFAKLYRKPSTSDTSPTAVGDPRARSF
jgi:hypothetical protein